MKNLMLSTAILSGLAGVALAQSTTADEMFRTQAAATDILASDFIGMRLYASESAVDAPAYDGVQDGWNDIGEVNDVVLGQDGSVQAVLVDIGGFLGMGERQVAVQMPAIKFVADDATADNAADFFLVLNANRAALETAPAYGADAAMSGTATDQAAKAANGGISDTAPAVAQGGTSDTTTMATGDAAATDKMREPVARDGYAALKQDALTTENLTSAVAYDSRDERIGEVSELILDADGQITQAVLDVGGFLGMGEKQVALPIADIDILRADGSGEVRVYVSHTKEQLEAMSDYES